MKLSTAMIAVLATAITTHSAMATDFYRWVDKNGTTHYTKTPPPKGGKLVGKTETYAVPVYQTSTPVDSSSNTSTTTYDAPPVVAPVSAPRNLAAAAPQYGYNNETINSSPSVPVSNFSSPEIPTSMINPSGEIIR